MMKEKFIQAYMKTAFVFAELSTAEKMKVGSIVVKDHRIISIGYNGTPSGWSNVCEDKIENPDTGEIELKTKPEVAHSESNAILKLARSHESALDATLFITHSPCINCAKMIYQAGISSVYYSIEYRSTDGIEFLKKCNISVHQVKETQ
jgi:dCMP deaminase